MLDAHGRYLCQHCQQLVQKFRDAAVVSLRSERDAVRVSEGTVKNHVSSILSKLGARDRTRAVLKALELGFI